MPKTRTKAAGQEKPDASAQRAPMRLVALTDGLFATVLTLLVLDLRLPDALSAQGTDMVAFLRWLGPHLFSYLLTFFVAGVYWLAHHRDFDHITAYDRGLLGYNLLFLLFVGLFPFSTAVISLVGFRNGSYPFYWAVYCANIILAGVMLTLTWLYAASHGLLSAGAAAAESRYIITRQLITPAVFLLSAISEYVVPQAYIGPYVLFIIPLARWFVDRAYARVNPDGRTGRRSMSDFLWRAGTTLIWLFIILLAAWVSTM